MNVRDCVNGTNSGGEQVTRERGKSAFDYTSLGEKGQIIDGVITQVSEQVSIDFGGTEIKISQTAVQNAREGEVRSFQIMDVSKNSIVLKEVEQNAVTSNGVLCTNVVNSQDSFVTHMEKAEETSGQDSKDAKEELENVSSRMTGKDYTALQEEGMSLEKYELERLERALNRIKEERLMEQHGIENAVAVQQEKITNIENVAKKSSADRSGNSKEQKIIKCLEEADLPVTEENIQSLLEVFNMSTVVPQMTEKTIEYMVEQELPPTIQNIYCAQYTGNSKNTMGYMPNKAYTNQMDMRIYAEGTMQSQSVNISQEQNVSELEESWNALRPQVEQLLLESGMGITESTMQQARWLFYRDLPITAESLVSLEELQNIKENFNVKDFLVKVAEQFSLGTEPKGVSLATERLEVTNQSVQVFLTEVDNELKKINKQLEDASVSLKEIDNPSESIFLSLQESTTIDIKTITKRRQLEEIKLKMSLQAATRLKNNGIELDIEHTEEIIEGLRKIEDEYFKGILQECGAEDHIENIHVLKETTRALEALRQAPSYIIGETIEQKDTITLPKLQDIGEARKIVLDRAGEAYDTMMTQPRTDLGDSMQKAFGNVDTILNDIGMEPTEVNQRAVKILAYNHMDINEDNVYRVKEYDTQVRQFIKDLHPAVTVELIKRNINPLDTPISELTTYVNELKDELGVTGEEKYSKYLWQLEQKTELAPQERKAYIGLYRLLNNVQKSEGAAVGYVLNTNRDVTLQNLLSAITTLKNGSINAEMTDTTGFAELQYTNEPLILQMKESFQTDEDNNGIKEKQNYFDRLVGEIIEDISPSGVQRTLVNREFTEENWTELMQKNVEQFAQEIKKEKEKNADLKFEEEILKGVRELADNSDRVISILTSNKIPVTIQNISAAQVVLGDKSFFKEVKDKSKSLSKVEQSKMQHSMEQIGESLESAAAMEEAYKMLETQMDNMISQEYSRQETTSVELNRLKLLMNGMHLVRQLSRKETYEIPVVAQNGITNIHLTVIQGTKESGRIQISMNSNQFGNVYSELSVKNNTVEGTILCDSKKSMDIMESGMGDLVERIEAQGMEQVHFRYGVETNYVARHEEIKDENVNNTNVHKLYQVAKAFVKHVGTIENE